MKRRILVIDNEEDLVTIMEAMLKAQGYEVLKALDGKKGLEIARKEKPDLILLDIRMPEVDGYSVCDLLKSDARYAKIPIIFFTGSSDETAVRLGERISADDYILKPFESSVLLEKIQGFLN